MNQIRAIQALNKREIENGVPPEASWHADYRDTAFIYFGGLPYELSEGDIITIFSQFGEPVFLKLVRDKETGKSKGFGWLKYEDQRSTDLAVDNLGGAEIGGRLIRVDHARYKMRDDEDLEEYKVGWEDMLRRERAEKGLPSESEDETDEEEEHARRARPMLKEERELQLLIQNHDDDDPMKQFLIDEKKKEVEEALRREKRREEKERRRHKDRDEDRHRHRSHRSSRRDDSEDERGIRLPWRTVSVAVATRDGGNAVTLLVTETAGERTDMTEATGRGSTTVTAEMTAMTESLAASVTGTGGEHGKARAIAVSVGIATRRTGDGATVTGVVADRHVGIEAETPTPSGEC
ncbi:f516c729-bf79-47c9-9caa-da2d17960dfe [Thermothielavioides terrestris]|uniref:F516c729-bf79-47c9-9caa-da2d17960dfe n=1 Tax=Thermothielavioides terrestris TaxID=2587410 RepID=A0A446BBF1_9PEZI|nr:f516c729-bf79-47c9-9caa-da2d17960dfe [Thermothielavioides terrestris]